MKNVVWAAGLAVALASSAGAATPSGAAASAKDNVLRCSKVREQYAMIRNGGPVTIPAGARVEVEAHGPTQQAQGSATALTEKDVPAGKSFLYPIRFDKTFTGCEAKVVD